MRGEYVEAVLDVAALIPAGKVLSYGDIAALLESGGPRQIGSVMSHHGSAVPWWRVIRASGLPPQNHSGAALVQYRVENTPLRGTTSGENPSWRVEMKLARWDPTESEFDAVDAIALRLATASLGSETDAQTLSEPRGLVES